MNTKSPYYEQLVASEYLFKCWNNFKRGKRKKKDIQEFERHREDLIYQLREEIITFTYQPASYQHFFITDPKQRYISKAPVRDRLIHEAVYQILIPLFDPKFIFHSYSCRKGKGIHIAFKYLQHMTRRISANHTKPCFGLKMDIKRFFDSVDHTILKTLIRNEIKDEKFLIIIDRIIDSYHKKPGKGLPLGSVTSQLFANIYMHPFDCFIKHQLRERSYLRYCDDFLILSNHRKHFESIIPQIKRFLRNELILELHPNKISIRKLSQGIDFVGYVLFPHHILMRTTTKRRMLRRLEKAFLDFLEGKIDDTTMNQKIQSYLGMLSHANQFTLSEAIKNAYSVL